MEGVILPRELQDLSRSEWLEKRHATERWICQARYEQEEYLAYVMQVYLENEDGETACTEASILYVRKLIRKGFKMPQILEVLQPRVFMPSDSKKRRREYQANIYTTESEPDTDTFLNGRPRVLDLGGESRLSLPAQMLLQRQQPASTRAQLSQSRGQQPQRHCRSQRQQRQCLRRQSRGHQHLLQQCKSQEFRLLQTSRCLSQRLFRRNQLGRQVQRQQRQPQKVTHNS
uniref:Ras-associating domain-containing protein n=1 Tax=Macrostomum lignano TaxID=282301 RepID=A0A1I8G6L1_9PLAT